MLPTEVLPYVVDEFTAYDSVGEMRDPCKLSPLSRVFGSMAQNSKGGEDEDIKQEALKHSEGKGAYSGGDGRVAEGGLCTAQPTYHFTRRFAGKLSDLAHNLFEYARLKYPELQMSIWRLAL